MAVYKGIIPYGGTFLVFSDYLRPAIRLSALSHYASIWLFTHDSIGLGEDGPTHQPIEQLAALRAIPNLIVLRPADANEVTEAWKFAVSSREGPTALILSRQRIPTIDRQKFSPASGLLKGAYVLADLGDGEPEIILMATGSEVNLIIDAGQQLEREGRNVRLVSFPSWELFQIQCQEYQNEVLKGVKSWLNVLQPHLQQQEVLNYIVSLYYYRSMVTLSSLIIDNFRDVSYCPGDEQETFSFKADMHITDADGGKERKLGDFKGTKIISFVSEDCPVSMVETVSKARQLADRKENVPVIVAPLQKLSRNHLAMASMIRHKNMFFINDEQWRKENLPKKIQLPLFIRIGDDLD